MPFSRRFFYVLLQSFRTRFTLAVISSAAVAERSPLPALRRVRVRLTNVLLDRRPSPPFSANEFPSLFEWFIGTVPPCDSSETYARAVRLLPSLADLLPG